MSLSKRIFDGSNRPNDPARPQDVVGGRSGAGGLGNPNGSPGILGGLAGGDAQRGDQGTFAFQRQVQQSLARRLEDLKIDLIALSPSDAQRVIETHLHAIIDDEARRQGLSLSGRMRTTIYERTTAEIIGFGPLDPLLADDRCSEIMVNGPRSVWVIRDGKMVRTDTQFQDDDHILRIAHRIVSRVGRRVDEVSPMVDARLPDGSRVNVVIPPVALDGPKITIRKFARHGWKPQDLVKNGTITAEMLVFLEACVRANCNIIVSGGTNSGKTSLLNVLSVFIPNDERIVTIEDAAELQMQQEHVVRLESRPATVEGKNRITIRDLLVNALRMAPRRIIVGECRGGEALDMLAAMNTGHDGSMTTIHANTARDVISRLEMLVLQGAGVDLPLRAIRQQIGSAVQLIVHMHLFEDGRRRVAMIAEVLPGTGEYVAVDPIFEFERKGIDSNGQITGRLRATEKRPHLLERLDSFGLQVPPSIFQNT